MEIIINETDCIEKAGVYHIRNTVNGKYYVGSAVNLRKRFNHHNSTLKNNKHKNSHLQHSFNKHGEDNFKFIVLFNCDKEDCFKYEQEEIDKVPFDSLYNINTIASGTPSLVEEVIKKRTISINKFREEVLSYYYRFKNQEITIFDIPEKFHVQIKVWSTVISNDGFWKKGHVPWNKGKTKADTDFSFLKGIKKKTGEKHAKARKQIGEKWRQEILPEIEVYDINMNFLGKWRCIPDLHEESLKDDFILKDKMILKNKNGRNGYSPHILQSFNMGKSHRTNTPYKGLYFKEIPKI